MQVIFSRMEKENKPLCVGLRCGGFTGFAAIRWDLRHLLRYGGCAAAALAVGARMLRRR